MEFSVGFGIIGNIAGHLEQAGEADDFITLGLGTDVPKGLFTFYSANSATFLSRFCFNSRYSVLPDDVDGVSFGIRSEPEIALECVLSYGSHNEVVGLNPVSFMCFDDATICNSEFVKVLSLSERKNYSSGSKALGSPIPIDKFREGGVCDRYCITSFLSDGGHLRQHGIPSPLTSYSFFYERLVSWTINQLNTQVHHPPLEHISPILMEANYPEKVLISIGATKYTPFGESRYLQVGDEVCIVAFDMTKFSNEDIKRMLESGARDIESASVIRRVVVRESSLR